MVSFRENIIHAKRKSVIVELVKGKEMAIQLQNLLLKPVRDDDGPPVSAQYLALQIFRSFTDTLSVLSSTCAAASSGSSAQIATAVRKKKAGVKDRRGSYKRRRTSESRMTISPVMGDGYAWRKYGQKVILNSEYPRCYFRCTNKYDQGCKAMKQVQRYKENPVLYQTTYFNHHTCTDHTPITRAPPLIVGPDPVEPSSLSFQTSIQSEQDHDHDQYYSTPMMIKKEESKQDTPISEDINVSGLARSSLDQWLEFTGSESFGYRPNWAPLMGSNQEEGCHSCGSICLHGLDMDVNQFGDIENFHFDEIF